MTASAVQRRTGGLPGTVCIKVTAQLAGGRQVSFDTTDPTGGTFRAGQRVRLAVAEQPGQPPYYNIQDLERAGPFWFWSPCSWGR